MVEIGALNATEELGWMNKMWKELSKHAWCPFCQLVNNTNGLCKWSCEDELSFFRQQTLRQNDSPQGYLCCERSNSLRESTGQDSRGVMETAIKISNCLLVFFLQSYVYFWVSSQHMEFFVFCKLLQVLNSPCLMEFKTLLWGALHSPIPIRSAVLQKAAWYQHPKQPVALVVL